MIEEMRKKGKPIDPKMEQMAAWLDNLAKDAGDSGMAGEVCIVYCRLLGLHPQAV